MNKVDPNKEVECTIVTSRKQILLATTTKQASPAKLNFTVRCAEEFMQGIRNELELQLKGSVLDSKSKLKPTEITAIELTFEDYETEQMKLSKLMRCQNFVSLEVIRYEAPIELGAMLKYQPTLFGQELFGALHKLLTVNVAMEETHSVIEITTEVPDEQIDRLRKDLLRMLQSEYIFSHIFKDEQVLSHFASILSKDAKLSKSVSYYRDAQNRQMLYVYTKDKELVRELLQHVNSLATRDINMLMIFQDRQVRETFYEYDLEPLQAIYQSLLFKRTSDNLEVTGQLHRVMEFETQLHHASFSYKCKRFQWKRNPLTLKLLKARKAEYSERNKQFANQNRDRRVFLFYPEIPRNIQNTSFEILLFSRNIAELQNQYRTLKLGLTAIKQEIVKVGRLGEYLNEINGSETLLAKLEKMFNVSLELEGDYLLIVGTEQNINGVKKKISSTELQSDEESVESIEENPKKQHQEQQKEVFELVLSERQYELLQNEVFSDCFQILDQRNSKGIFTVKRQTDNINEEIEIKKQLLEFLLRTKEEPWLVFPDSWGFHPGEKTVQVDYPIGSQAEYLEGILNLPKDGYIMRTYRVEDRDRYCLFHRTNKNHHPAVYISAYPLRALRQYIQQDKEIFLTKLINGKLVWPFEDTFRPNGKHQTLLIALVSNDCRPTCPHQHKFLPQYLLDINSLPSDKDLYNI